MSFELELFKENLLKFLREKKNTNSIWPDPSRGSLFPRMDKTITDFTIPSQHQNKVEILKDCQMRTTEPLTTEGPFRLVKMWRAFTSKFYLSLSIWEQHLIR